LLAGLLLGLCCYGYPAVRLHLPVLLAVYVALTARAWWRIARRRRGRLALAALVVGTGVTFGPLAYKHVTEPEVIGKRGRMTWVWSADDALPTRAAKVFQRYAAHFDPHFLFRTGDQDETFWTVNIGFIPWYWLPLQVAGLAWTLRRLPYSRSVRLLLAGVVLFPVGDALNANFGLHILHNLRSSTGLFALLLPAAVGWMCVVRYVSQRRMTAWVITVIVGVLGVAVPQTMHLAHVYLVERPRKQAVYHGLQVDLTEACTWLRPRLADIDACVFTPRKVNQPYLVAAVALQHDPKRWQTEPREVIEVPGQFDICRRFGRFYFPESGAVLEACVADLRNDGIRQRVALCVRPNDLRVSDPDLPPPAFTIVDPEDDPTLMIYLCDW
jgi:hypothetical protein